MKTSVLLAVLAASWCAAAPALAADPPRTGFEQRNGATWTTYEEERAFLDAVDRGSRRMRLTAIGKTAQGRITQLVELGHPVPRGRDAALDRPTVLLVCSQHGNEPSGREACLKMLRDLAFSSDAALLGALRSSTLLFVPTANPDGRAANTRGNAAGIDVNRDHVTLESGEARAIAEVVRDWRPDTVVDLHEYGPSQPVVYDDSVLWLWPRNLNTDQRVHDLAIELGRSYLVPSANEAGFTTDEYGQAEIVDNDVAQTAGDGDEGILRNAMGLRHALGILVETRTDADVRTGLGELTEVAQVQRRRVDSHLAVLRGLMRFVAERGAEAMRVSAAAADAKLAEGEQRSTPVYFGGADNQEPPAGAVVNPPPCGYELAPADVEALGPRLGLLGIDLYRPGGKAFVPLAQWSEPLVPLVLDSRGARHLVSATALDACPLVALRCEGIVRVRLPRVRGRVRSIVVRAPGRTVRLRRATRSIRVRVASARGRRVRIRVVATARRAGHTLVTRTARRYRVC